MPSSSKPPIASIEALAERLATVTLDDSAELEAIRAELELIAEQGSGPGFLATKKLFCAAAKRLQEIVSGDAGDRATGLTVVRKLVSAATRLSVPPPTEEAEAGQTEPSVVTNEEEARIAAVELVPAPSIGAASRRSVEPPSEATPPARTPTLLPADYDGDLVKEFLTESAEHIVNAEAALLSLESHPEDKASIDTVFRAFHTIKGVSAMLGMNAVAKLAHHAESLLSRVSGR